MGEDPGRVAAGHDRCRGECVEVALHRDGNRTGRWSDASGGREVDAAVRGKPREGRRHSADPRVVGLERHEVGLGEVAVVVRLLLRAQRVRAARRPRPSGGSPARPARRLRAGRSGASPRTRWRDRATASEFRFLISQRVPSVSVPAARTDTLASTRIEPSSIFTSDTPVASEDRAQLGRRSACACSAAADVGPAHDLDERHAGAVVVDERVRRRRGCDPPPPTWVDLPVSSSRWARSMPMRVPDGRSRQPSTLIGSSYWVTW